MEDSLLQDGLTLMVAGMGTVFAFLTSLVAAMKLMSRILAQPAGGAVTEQADDERARIAAIAAAIRVHRKR
jgi:sodium pump decarboxylase gamma subunit